MLRDHLDDHVDNHIDDLNAHIEETFDDGLVDAVGGRDDQTLFITVGTDDAVYDSGKTLSVIKQTPQPRTVQYVTQHPHSLVVDNLNEYMQQGILECYAGSESHGVISYTPFGSVDDEPRGDNAIASYILDTYASNDEERQILRHVLDYFNP
jgi:hypothetical protein